MSTRPLQINEVLPWGRSLEEYRSMFALSTDDLQRTILSCADGPASFNAEMTHLGNNVTSVDPVYRFSAAAIRSRIDETRDMILENMRGTMDGYIWDTIPDLKTLESIRMKAMDDFLYEFEAGKREGRYVEGGFPELTFDDRQFDLVLCSHCLFTYTEQLDEAFHVAAVREMVRVGEEVRVFPLLDMNGGVSRHVQAVEETLQSDGATTTRVTVDYEFQKGGNQYLKIESSG
jgi:SAM-dependent methyltransferase